MDFLSPLTLALYGGAIFSTLFYVWKCWQKETLLPQACHYEDLSLRINRAKKELELLEISQKSLQEILSQKAFHEIELNGLFQQRTMYQQELQQNRQELISQSAERQMQESLRSEITMQEKALNELQKKHEENKSGNKDLENKAHNLQTELNKLQREINNSAEVLKNLDAKITQHKSTVKMLEIEKVDKIALVKELEHNVAALTLEESNLAANVAESRDEFKRLSERDQDLKLMMEKRFHELTRLEEALNKRHEQLDKLNAEQTVSENSVSKVLARPYINAGPKRAEESEMESLNYFEHYLRNEGLQFDQRTLYRFHTSLKITTHCPLVILSGISGTGKTLLAQSYAAACGLHFLPLAVQPRWDSPQDLFGYYDFTKQQFAATELSRALVQMDPYNRDQWSDVEAQPQWINDNLLMVLIDEMNIARVEYYFSELLSKLELRKNCTMTGESSRKTAEISLGNCILPATEKEVSFYIDYNVLFVGTLNEDETTLTLSDKILDRANVIHFGKPDNFTQKGKNSTPRQDKGKLSFQTWKKWIKDESSIPKDWKSEIDSLLKGFNRHMGEIGRPIGHRTYQAILAYIANYPSKGSEANWKEALADQVEQKLMTRLRGVDLSNKHNSIGEIENLIKTLDDEKLIERFSHAKENSYFDWK